MQGNASVLGILPPATVRIDLDGWVQDWPFECVELTGETVVIDVPGFVETVATPMGTWARQRRRVIIYAYEHAHRQDDGSWLFVGAEDFTVTAGPPQPASVN